MDQEDRCGSDGRLCFTGRFINCRQNRRMGLSQPPRVCLVSALNVIWIHARLIAYSLRWQSIRLWSAVPVHGPRAVWWTPLPAIRSAMSGASDK